MTRARWSLCTFLAVAGWTLSCDRFDRSSEAAVTITVRDSVVSQVSSLLFGQFMERAGKHEPGPDCALGPDGRTLRSDVTALLDSMHIPIIRYPAGGALPAMGPWTDFVDNYPDSGDTRAQPDAFGYHEYLELAERLGAQSVLPVRFRPALWKSHPLADEAALAAGLVAYCNAPPGASLPDGMPNWPAIRAANGHPEPFGVRYFQIGNEWPAYFDATAKVAGITHQKEQIAWAKACAHAIADAMRSVDPSIRIVIEGSYWEPHQAAVIESLLADTSLRNKTGLAAYHLYKPWFGNALSKDGVPCKAADLSEDEKWLAVVATPTMDSQGRAVLRVDTLDDGCARGRVLEWAPARGWHIAMTEWNWNGVNKDPVLNNFLAKGIGAAGFLHAILRSSDKVKLATQSMLIGSRWQLAAIHVPSDTAPAFLRPTAQVTALYSRYHGNRRLHSEVSGAPVRTQPIQYNQIMPQARVAMVDAVVTANDTALFVHAINRELHTPHRVRILLDGMRTRGSAVRYTLDGPIPGDKPVDESARLTKTDVRSRAKKVAVELPPRSVSVVVIPVE